MKKINFLLLLIVLVSCSRNSYPKFDIKLPSSFEIEIYKQEYDLLTASKYVDGNIEGMIELRYSDDWSFSTFSNNQYIEEMLNSNKFEDASTMMFNNFKIQIKEKIYFKNLGHCFYSIYSGDYYANNVRITNVVIQFIKNDKLFTLIGSAFPENFPKYHKEFLKSFETLKL